MNPRLLAHLSDLHLGRSKADADAARRLVDALLEARVDHAVVTGDLTHRGLLEEHDLFLELFAPLARHGRLTVVPGNHDRQGDDAGQWLTRGQRVWTEAREGLWLVCVDSTAPHNRIGFRAHGQLCEETLAAVDLALADAPPGSLTAVLLHHHPVPLPTEGVGEWLAHQLGWPHASELTLGTALLDLLAGRADLVLHGHRHRPRRLVCEHSRPLQVVNAGSSTALGACRLFSHADGRLEAAPHWLCAAPAPGMHRTHELVLAPA